MSQIPVKFYKNLNPPAEPATGNALYFVQPEPGARLDSYLTDDEGNLVALVNAEYIIGVMASAMALKANLANPALSGIPTAPTAALGTSTTQLATTAYVVAVRDAILNAAPGVLDTLQELAEALGEDPEFAATMTAALAAKEASANKDTENGYVGIAAWKIKFRNIANSFTSFFQNTNTAARTYIFQDRNGTIADDTDIAGRQPLDSDLTSISGLSTTSFGRSLLTPADAAAAKMLLEIIAPIPLSYLDTDGTLAADSDLKVASQKAVNTKIAAAIANLINSAPGALDTLDELAAAFGDDPNFAATMATALALKAPLASPALSGTPTAPTAAAGTNTTQIASTAHVLAERTNAAVITSKRIKKRVYTVANTATLTPEIDTYDVFAMTGLTGAVNVANHSTSTPDDGDMILIRFKDNGTARAISHGSNYVSRGGTLLTTTAISKWSRELFEWNTNTSKWECISAVTEA